MDSAAGLNDDGHFGSRYCQVPCSRYSGERWYVLRSEPKHEKFLLERIAYPAWVPMLSRQWIDRTWHETPLFPGYVFVLFDRDDDGWGALCSLAGVMRGRPFLGRPYAPDPLPEGFVERMQASAEGNIAAWLDRYGDVTFAKPARKSSRYQPGDELTVTDGPFERFSAVCRMTDGDRLLAAITMFGRRQEVWMDCDVVRAA